MHKREEEGERGSTSLITCQLAFNILARVQFGQSMVTSKSPGTHNQIHKFFDSDRRPHGTLTVVYKENFRDYGALRSFKSAPFLTTIYHYECQADNKSTVIPYTPTPSFYPTAGSQRHFCLQASLPKSSTLHWTIYRTRGSS